MKKAIYIGIGVLAVGVAYYFYNKSKKPTTGTKKTDTDKKQETTEETKSNFVVKCGDEAQGHWYQKSYPCRSAR